MNKLLIKIAAVLLAIIMVAFLAFSSGLMANISFLTTENFDVLDTKKDTLNFEF